jgi:hypothetical protein
VLSRLLEEGHKLAVAPQMLAEFVHVVTDSKRLKDPLSMEEALARAESKGSGMNGAKLRAFWDDFAA